MTSDAVRDAKTAVRERVWSLLERERIARFPGAHGRIPNFVGAERAAARLGDLDLWRAARVVKANPDSPQLPVRRRALVDAETVYVAVPRLAGAKPFIRLGHDATIKGRDGRRVGLSDLGHVDVIVCGTVAVNRDGVRVGKGGGFSDLEFALLVEEGLVDETTSIATTVHRLQLLDEELPQTAHDFRVDVIVTPEDVIEVQTGRRERPPGLIWEHLDEAKIAAIPVLAARRA